MKRAALLPSAFLLDQLAGDPEWFPHPVRLMGLAITHGERILRRENANPLEEFVSGSALTASLVAGSFFLTRRALLLAYKKSATLGSALELVLAWTCLASRNLQQEAGSVMAALDAGDLTLARHRLARIVGRDTAELDASEISRALIETLAESASDGIVAPLFYLALGGPPLAMAYKAVNTLDSMIGHRDHRYLHFGKAAARLDDAANLLPARLTAAGFVAVSTRPRSAWATWCTDGGRHRSPNAGQPEAAVAGALRVALGGINRYDGEIIASPRMGAGYPPATAAKAREAMRLTLAVSLFGLACGVAIAALCERRGTR